MMNNEIIQLKSELLKRSTDYFEKRKNETDHIPVEGIEASIDHLFRNVMDKGVKT